MNNADDFMKTGDFFSAFPPGSNTADKKLPLIGQTEDEQAPSIEYSVKYGVYDLGPYGNADLEEIMSACVNGKKLLGWERVNTTKDGDTQVIIKYLEIVPPKQSKSGKNKKESATESNADESKAEIVAE